MDVYMSGFISGCYLVNYYHSVVKQSDRALVLHRSRMRVNYTGKDGCMTCILTI
jgi:hypothetical protein